ncbi:hypothetical protein GH714_029965 [Hevea brasiliensis]|uniref:Glutamyl-tRNA reductase n=1 Tax=Hevea brasiliensis TaxID=3981 RepID=A0A6A6N3I0_HEVBR|nr:hypothetical protein GH714_029965 [Hevea brasiliensis]
MAVASASTFAASSVAYRQMQSSSSTVSLPSSSRLPLLRLFVLDRNSSTRFPRRGREEVAGFSSSSFFEELVILEIGYTKERSSIAVIGLNVHTAPVEIREKLAIPEAQWPQAINELSSLNHIEEAAVLSTCNRMEIYVVALSQHRGVKEVTEWMSKRCDTDDDANFFCRLVGFLFLSFASTSLLYNRDATRHLFEVASGLNSVVLGEGQILAQVKQVKKLGQGVSGFGRKISGLFEHAIIAGKRVRTETNIASGSVSVSSAAVELGQMKLPESSYNAARVLVIGAGKMGKLVIKHLAAKGCTKMVVVNRTEERIDAIREELKDTEIIYKPLSEMMACACEADVIFTCTASEAPLFLKVHVQRLPPVDPKVGRRFFIDISVPRNVEPSVSDLETAEVYNVDDLKEVVAANKEDRLRKAMEAQAVISEELHKFEAWKDSLETVPTIKKLRAYLERIRASELDKCLSKMGDISEKQKKAVYDLSMGMLKKFLHGPMQHLRLDANDCRKPEEILEIMHAVNTMFDLETEIILDTIRSKVERTQNQKKYLVAQLALLRSRKIGSVIIRGMELGTVKDAFDQQLSTVRDTFERVAKRQKLSSSKSQEVIDQVSHEIEQTLANIKSVQGLMSPVDQKSILTELKHKLNAISPLNQLEGSQKELNIDLSKYPKLLEKSFNSDISKTYRNVDFDFHIVNQIIASHFYRQGQFDLGDCLINEAGEPEATALRSQFLELHQILDAIKVKNLEPALKWASTNREMLQLNGSNLELKIHRLQFLEILKGGNRAAALNYARTFLSPLASLHMREIQKLVVCICWIGKLESNPHSELLDPTHWEKLSDELTRDFCNLLGHSCGSPLTLAMAAGIEGLPTLLKLANVMAAKRQEWLAMKQLPVPVELKRISVPFDFRLSSKSDARSVSLILLLVHGIWVLSLQMKRDAVGKG